MSNSPRHLTGLAAVVDPDRLCPGITQDHLTRVEVRAYTIEPGDILHDWDDAVVTAATEDPFNGQCHRKVHLDTDQGPIALPLNEPTTISRASTGQ